MDGSSFRHPLLLLQRKNKTLKTVGTNSTATGLRGTEKAYVEDLESNIEARSPELDSVAEAVDNLSRRCYRMSSNMKFCE